MEPEYGFLDPPPPEDHLHEAIQRLLLNQIHNMKEDIKLNTDKLRTLPDLKHYDTQDTTTPFGVSIGQVHSSPEKRNKRVATRHDGDNAKGTKRLKKTEESSKRSRGGRGKDGSRR